MPEVADLWVNLRAINTQYKRAMAEATAEGERFAESTTMAERATTRAQASTAAMGAEMRRTTTATRGLTTEVRAAESSAARFASRSRLASEQAANLANKASLASAEARRLAEQAAAGGEGASKLERQSRSAATQAERLASRARLAGENARWLGTQAGAASAEARRLAAQEAAAAAETERLGMRATGTATRVAALGAEARHTAGSVGVLSGSTMRLGGALASANEKSGKFASGLKTVGTVTAAVAVGAGVVSMKMAGDFEQGTNLLVTAAGEAEGDLGKVRSGILEIARDTGTTWHDLTEGMYQAEKAGFRAANGGLTVLKVASQGAREEGAKLDTVVHAMTTVMNNYNLPASQSVQVMNAIKTAAGGSTTTLEEFAGSLSTVLPLAAQAHISFDDVAGSLASMTRQGETARHASQLQAFAIRGLLSPNNVARKSMDQVGVSATDLQHKLSKRGLTGTIDYLWEVIAKKMGPSGDVVIGTMKRSASATEALHEMLGQMPPDLRRAAQAFDKGSLSAKEFTDFGKGMGAQGFAMASQYKALTTAAHGFSDQVKAGNPAFTTATDLMKKMTGGSNGLMAALEIGGAHQKTTAELVKKTGDSFHHTTKDVEGWESTQKLFNVQMDMFKQKLETAAISLGTKLLPYAIRFFGWMESHKSLVKKIAIGIGAITIALGAAGVAMIAFEAVSSPVGLIAAAVALVAIGLVYLWNTSQKAREIMTDVFAVISLSVLEFGKVALTMFKYVVQGFLDMASGLLAAASVAFSWVPGIGGKINTASVALLKFSNDTGDAIDGMTGKINEWQTSVMKLPHKIKVEGDIKDLEKKLGDVKTKMSKKNLPPEKLIKLTADKTDLEKKLLEKKREIAESPKEQRTLLTAQIAQWGKDIAAAKKQLDSVPKSQQAKFKGDIAQLVKARKEAQLELAKIHDKTVTITANTIVHPMGGPARATLSADGSLWGSGGMRRMADGTANSRQAMIAPGNSWILWAETAQPEAYIPLDRGKRQRSRKIATQVVKELGGAVSWMANGSITPMASGGINWSATIAKSTIPKLTAAGRQLAGGTPQGITGLSAQQKTSWAKAGKDLSSYLSKGLVQGLTGTTAQMNTALKSIKSQVTKYLGTDLVQVVNQDNKKLQSLDKQRASLVKQLHDAEAKTGKGTRSQRAAAAKRASDLKAKIADIDKQEKGLRKEISTAKAGQKTGSALTKMIDADTKKLTALAKQRDSVASKLKSAQDKLADLKNDWAQKKSQVSDSVMGGLTAVTAANETGRPINAADILKQYEEQARKAQQFAALLQQLKSKGLNSATLDQLAAAGVEGGYDSALGLAGGTAGQIQQINALQKQTQAAADKAGTAVADSMYAAGIRSAQGLVDGLAKQQAAIEKQMEKIASSMEKAIKKALGIKSPSRVMAQVGDYSALGVAVGLSRSSKHAVIAAQGMAMQVRQAAAQGMAVASPSAPVASLALTGRGSGGGTTVIDQSTHYHVAGSVISERKLGRLSETQAQRRGMRNSDTYAPYRR
ncbi:phage tail tape measure protein [Streptomyces sp. NPDC092296]|uniref:phage tail tape measure protein n=1 Tax=Streptomyces sp. NPDC092296 TaxID=3366012 RepID=UPI00381B135F